VRSLCAVVLSAGLFAAPGRTAAEQGGNGENGMVNEPRPTVRPTRATAAPQIDGVLDDEIWRTATRITGLSQQRPLEGALPTEETEIWTAYDDESIYFAFNVHYSDPSVMRHTRTDRDRIAQDDLITIYFDTFNDGQRVYEFDVNGYNVQGDGILGVNSPGGSSAAIPRADRSWDAIFDSGTEMRADGFSAEMAIPYKSLRYPSRAPGEEHRWGFQLVREIKGKNNEQVVWAPMSRAEANFFVQMGYIEGMTDLGSNRNIEIRPQLLLTRVGALDRVDATFDSEEDAELGLNVKYGVTSNLTADFTVNPDFSQVETDAPQIEINRRDPLFFSELRPFFVEGAEIFSISGPVTFVHTRTIVDPLFGVKLTGKVGPFAVGVVATDDQAPGNVDPNDDPFGAHDQSAKTLIARARYDLFTQSTAGVVFTDRQFLDGHSRLAGSDVNLRLTSTFSTSFRAVKSWNRDLDGTESDGEMLQARFGRNGRSVGWTLDLYQISPDFDTAVGFVRRRDQRVIDGDLGYTFYPESTVLTWGPQVSYSRAYMYDDVVLQDGSLSSLQDEELTADVDVELVHDINLGAGIRHAMELFRGVEFDKNSFNMNASAALDAAARVTVSGNVSVGEEICRQTSTCGAAPFLGDQFNWGLSTRLRPIPRLDYSINLNAQRLTDPRNGHDEIFNVKTLRGAGNLQLTDRLTMRNITEYNTSTKTFGFNLLFTYRVNAGTVFYAGYNDRYQERSRIDAPNSVEPLFPTDTFERTNQQFFAKFQYLFRY
jgi:hypothetical protein